MSTIKRVSKQKLNEGGTGPTATRPHISASAYGIPKDTKGLLPWSHVTDRMEKAQHYWVCTVDPDGRPHATPVDGLWLDDQLYFGGSPDTRRNRNLAANPAVCVHLESAGDVVIVHGDARELRSVDRALTTRLAEASRKKYGYGASPEQISGGGTYVLRPRVAFAWKQFPKDVTRWTIPNRS